MSAKISAQPLAINQARAINIVMELLSVPGISREERDAAAKVIQLLARAGVPRNAFYFDDANQKSPYGGNCGNLIVKIPGTMNAPERMLSAHLDTVPICKEAKPVRRGGIIYSANPGTGLGADNRSGCAAIVTAVVEILERKLPHPPLTLLFTVQEEIGLVGARFVNTKLIGKPKVALNIDGGAAESMAIGATGGMHMDIEITGLASHAGGAPERGVSAGVIAAYAITDLTKNGWFGLVNKGGVRGTSNIGRINGGAATNVVMDKLVLDAECRSYSVPLRKRIALAYKKAFEDAAKKVVSADGKRGSVKFTSFKKYDSFKIPKNDAGLAEITRVLTQHGLTPGMEYSNGGLDANYLAEKGINAPTIGAGSQNAHTDKEQLIISQYLQGCSVALNIAAAK